MVKFAAEAREKVSLLTQKLDLELGPGTAGLQVRIGLHSGPVTAGVLRGQKARFQLFGDTGKTIHTLQRRRRVPYTNTIALLCSAVRPLQSILLPEWKVQECQTIFTYPGKQRSNSEENDVETG